MAQVEGGLAAGDGVADDEQGEGVVASVAEIGEGSVVVTDQQGPSVFSEHYLAEHGEEDEHEALH